MTSSVLQSKIIDFAEKDSSKLACTSLEQSINHCWEQIYKKRAPSAVAVFQKGVTEEAYSKEKKAGGLISANMLVHYVSQNMKGVKDVEQFNKILQTPLNKISHDQLKLHNIDFKDLILDQSATIQQALQYLGQGACAVGVYQNESLALFSGMSFLQWLLKNETQLKDFLHQKLETCQHKFSQGVTIVNEKETVLSCIEKVGQSKDFCLAIVNDESKLVCNFGLRQVFMFSSPEYSKFLTKPVIEFLHQAKESCPDIVHKPLTLKKSNTIFDLVSQLTQHKWIHGVVVDEMMKPLVVFNPIDIAHWFTQTKGSTKTCEAGGTSMAS